LRKSPKDFPGLDTRGCRHTAFAGNDAGLLIGMSLPRPVGASLLRWAAASGHDVLGLSVGQPVDFRGSVPARSDLSKDFLETRSVSARAIKRGVLNDAADLVLSLFSPLHTSHTRVTCRGGVSMGSHHSATGASAPASGRFIGRDEAAGTRCLAGMPALLRSTPGIALGASALRLKRANRISITR